MAKEAWPKPGTTPEAGSLCSDSNPIPGDTVKLKKDVAEFGLVLNLKDGTKDAWHLSADEVAEVVDVDNDFDFSLKNPKGQTSGFTYRKKFCYVICRERPTKMCADMMPVRGDVVVLLRDTNMVLNLFDGTENAFILKPGEEARVIRVDKDGDFNIQNPKGEVSGSTFRKKFAFKNLKEDRNPPKPEYGNAPPPAGSSVQDTWPVRGDVIELEPWCKKQNVCLEDGTKDAWHLDVGEEAHIVKVDGDGDVKLRNPKGEISGWTYRYKYRYKVARKYRQAENLVVHPKCGYPSEGRYFPLGENSECLSDWKGFMSYLEALKAMMVPSRIKPKGPELSAARSIALTKENFYTTVLATVHCPGWSIGWASSVAALIAQCHNTCSELKLMAVQGGPVCDEECAFIDIICQTLGFRRKTIESVGALDVVWTWIMERPGALPLKVLLSKNYVIQDINAFDFRPKQCHNQVPNLKRVGVVSCAEHWPPEGEQCLSRTPQVGDIVIKNAGKPQELNDENGNENAWHLGCEEEAEAMAVDKDGDFKLKNPRGEISGYTYRKNFFYKGPKSESKKTNDAGKTVNDVLNERILWAMDEATKKAETEGFEKD